MIWAYAITDDVDEPLPGPDLRALPGHGVCAVVSEHLSDTGAEALLRHERVVEALMDTRAVLPLRYGTVLRDERAVSAALREHGREWSELLDRLRGRVELAASVAAAEERVPAGTGGRDYLMRKVERHRHATEIAAQLDAAVGDLATAVHHRSAPGYALKAAYLVKRADARDVRCRIEQAGAVCTGPWPPYSFTTRERLT